MQRTATSIPGVWRPPVARSRIETLYLSLPMPSLPLLPVALLVGLVSPTPDTSPMTQESSGAGEIRLPSALDSARVEVVAGRAVVVGGEFAGETVRRGESRSVRGRTHLEVALGGQVRQQGRVRRHVLIPPKLECGYGPDTQRRSQGTEVMLSHEARRGGRGTPQ